MVLRTVYDYGPAKHVRLDYADGHKDMRWEPTGVRMADLPLWNADLLDQPRFAEDPVLFVEGEKCANRCVRFGFLAVSLPGGASQRDFGHALEPLKGRDVVLLPDGDTPGEELMFAVGEALFLVGAARVRWLTMLPSDHDIADYFDRDAEKDMRGARRLLQWAIERADVIF